MADHSEALAQARNRDMQMPNAEKSHPGDLHMHGAADNYSGAPKEGSADNYTQAGDVSHVDRLAEARKMDKKNKKAENITGNPGDVARALSPLGATSLIKQIDYFHDIPFFAAFGAAILKDFLDFIGIGSLPAIGTVVTVCASLFIGAMLLLVGSGGRRRRAVAKRWMRKFGVLGAGTLGEMFLGLNFLPIETLTVLVIYIMSLKDRMRSDNSLK